MKTRTSSVNQFLEAFDDAVDALNYRQSGPVYVVIDSREGPITYRVQEVTGTDAAVTIRVGQRIGVGTPEYFEKVDRHGDDDVPNETYNEWHERQEHDE